MVSFLGATEEKNTADEVFFVFLGIIAIFVFLFATSFKKHKKEELKKYIKRNSVNQKGQIQPKNNEELAIWLRDFAGNCKNIDTSLITDLTGFFIPFSKEPNEFFEGISDWNVSNVESFRQCFAYCKNFNQPLFKNTSNGKDFSMMLFDCVSFNQPINLETSNGEAFYGMFANCSSLNQKIYLDFSKAQNIDSVFHNCTSLKNIPDNYSSKLQSLQETKQKAEEEKQRIEQEKKNTRKQRIIKNVLGAYEMYLSYEELLDRIYKRANSIRVRINGLKAEKKSFENEKRNLEAYEKCIETIENRHTNKDTKALIGVYKSFVDLETLIAFLGKRKRDTDKLLQEQGLSFDIDFERRSHKTNEQIEEAYKAYGKNTIDDYYSDVIEYKAGGAN